MEEHRPKVAAIVSGLTPQELFTEVAKLWKTYKEFLTNHNGDDEERLTELWETKLEELLVKRNEERNADKEVKDDAEEKEAVEAVVVEKGEEVKEKKPKTAKTAKPVEFAKRPKMNKEEKDKKGGKKKTEESEVEKKESEDEENSS